MDCINSKKFPCNTSLTMHYIGGKWKAVILSNLKNGKKRYSELRKAIPSVTERTLSLQLKQLEADGLIKRKAYNSKPPLKVEYELSNFGESLIPVLNALSEWGKETAKKVISPRSEISFES